MLVLAFDTATPAITIAVCEYSGGEVSVRARFSSVDARRHGELLTPGIRATVHQASVALTDLTHIAVGVGPGPYTGLRVGLATAQALATALGVPCHGVHTLDALALASRRTTPFIAAGDARRKEVFWARYTDSATRVGEIAVDHPAEIETAGVPVIGHGASLYPEALPTDGAGPGPLYPTAEALGEIAVRRLAAGEPLEAPLPVYLRRPDAREPGEAKRVRQERQP